jgi:hypothetical protein
MQMTTNKGLLKLIMEHYDGCNIMQPLKAMQKIIRSYAKMFHQGR